MSYMYENPIGPKPDFPDVQIVIDDSGSTFGYMCKGGDITPENFLGGIWWADGNDHELTLDFIKKAIREEVVRCIPVSPSLREHVAYSYMYHPSKAGRGAFMATFIDLY